jgi:hypothetical protein
VLCQWQQCVYKAFSCCVLLWLCLGFTRCSCMSHITHSSFIHQACTHCVLHEVINPVCCFG